MYTTHDNLEHTIKLQEQLFRQRLRLRGIAVDDDDNNNDDGNESSSSEHLYDNIDGEASDIENKTTVQKKCHKKKSRHNITFSTDDDEQQQQQQEKSKISKHHKVRFIDQYHAVNKRKNFKSNSKTNLTKTTNSKRNYSSNINQKKFSLPLASNMLTVTIT